ncbi:GNAT family N-acetyltransferase [Sinorhizobium sp. RAC02]|uniref:GNAT family N-acetyltransferase n=1 Tax=Sinorhizobium sp. RAC02 TaxID=1842534 RepID=UPI00083D1239|nr:GNAT family N-acetyltransferase [Sinorhizobium sp. RAC02]AOF94324.1 acetyltransferase family protein [Sinorhizobium sp. RAC02]
MPSLSIVPSSGSPSLDIRSLNGNEDRRKAFAVFRQALLGIGDFGRTSPETETRFLAEGQSLGGFEGDILRGVVNGYDSSITLPGGRRVRHLSVTHVGVSPDATRRGIARQLIVEQLRRARSEGYVVAGLRASDTGIYGRYGYGIASWSVRHELDLTRAELATTTPREELRIVDARENFPLFRQIADSDPTPRATTLSRWDGWWAMQEFRTIHGTTPYHAVVFGPEGNERGYLRFHIEPSDNWFTSSQRTVIIDDLIAHDDEAWRGLIGHLFTQDILHRAVFPSQPVDDPLPLFLRNPRTLEISGQRDESWIRPLNLAALLSARRFGGTRQVTLAVEDDLFPDNSGLWSIGKEGAVRSTERPEARLAIADLATLIFGAHQATSLAASERLWTASGEITEELDLIFACSRRPHSGISF